MQVVFATTIYATLILFMESTSIGPHLHDDPLDDETQKIINRIADGLPDRDWEEHEEGKITAVKDVSNIRNDMIEVKESFKVIYIITFQQEKR